MQDARRPLIRGRQTGQEAPAEPAPNGRTRSPPKRGNPAPQRHKTSPVPSLILLSLSAYWNKAGMQRPARPSFEEGGRGERHRHSQRQTAGPKASRSQQDRGRDEIARHPSRAAGQDRDCARSGLALRALRGSTQTARPGLIGRERTMGADAPKRHGTAAPRIGGAAPSPRPKRKRRPRRPSHARRSGCAWVRATPGGVLSRLPRPQLAGACPFEMRGISNGQPQPTEGKRLCRRKQATGQASL